MEDTNTVTHDEATQSHVTSEDMTDIIGLGMEKSDTARLHTSLATYPPIVVLNYYS